MKRSLQLSPAQLAALCIGGGLVTGFACFLPHFFCPSFESIGYFHQMVVIAAFSMPGSIIRYPNDVPRASLASPLTAPPPSLPFTGATPNPFA
jgi:hypothetical protein